eukprot:COSAG01_NODE_10428_length_2168_cov_2.003867_2_plen_330_part_01
MHTMGLGPHPPPSSTAGTTLPFGGGQGVAAKICPALAPPSGGGQLLYSDVQPNPARSQGCVATISCPQGWNVDGTAQSTQLVCGWDGTWSGAAPTQCARNKAGTKKPVTLKLSNLFGIYQVGMPVTLSFTGATDAKDWIGIYRKGTSPGVDKFDGWTYHKSAHGSGQVTITPGGGGQYYAVMLCCDGYSEISQRVPFTVKGPPKDPNNPPFISVLSSGPFYVGQPIAVSFSGVTHNKDWIGLYHKGDVPGTHNSHHWSYHNSTENVGTVQIIPKHSGDFFIVMFCCDGEPHLPRLETGGHAHSILYCYHQLCGPPPDHSCRAVYCFCCHR